MAFTNQDIINAYNQTVGAGTMSEADFVSQAQSQYGVSADQLGSARSQMMGTTAAPTAAPAPSYSPAPAQTYTTQNIVDAYNNKGSMSEADFVTGAKSNFGITDAQLTVARNSMLGTPTASNTGRFTDAQYSAARDWANGKDWGTIAAKGSELGLTADEMGRVFGQFGGSGSQVSNLTGYGSGATGFNADGSLKYNTSFSGGTLADGSNPNDWKFDSTQGWVKAAKKAPTTGTAVNQWNSDAPSTGINLSNLQNANMWQVQPNQTVQSQLQDIIANDSPLMQQARARALQTANQRGLLNSSMAVTAGDSALYDAAMPIAQQDASTYADAAKFNTGEQNTFARDNNAFTRDAFMADFNLAANEWAKQQDQQRTYDQLDYTQKLTLDRDAIQNGYQSARDAIQNGYTVARDATTNAFTLQRDATQNQFTADQAALDRVAAMQRTAAGIQTPQPDTSVLRTQMQIDANRETANQTRIDTARTNLYQSKTDWGVRVAAITGGSGTQAQKDEAIAVLTSTYTPIISSYATQAGLNPSDYIPTATTPAAAPAASTPNVVTAVTGGGTGQWVNSNGNVID